MDVALKVTDQPQESSFFDLVSGDNVLSIPLFQRPYRWSQRNLDWLLDDVADIRAGLGKSCFLGVVVTVSRGASPGRPIPWEIVDGQQRLSTLYLLLMAATDVAARNQQLTWAAGVIGTYLLVRPLADNPVNTKLIPSFNDRTQFKNIWDSILAIPNLASQPSVAANLPRPPAPSGPEAGALSAQFGRMRRRLQTLVAEGGHEALSKTVEIAASKLSVVAISLRDPMVAPKIFERLNNRAELVTVADLVRNEVFARASDDAAQAAYVFSNHWEPFTAKFARIDNGLEKFLFPYGLILNRQLTKADLFSQLRSHWQALQTPSAIIADMQRLVGPFLTLEGGISDLDAAPEVQIRLDRIYRLGRPSSIFAFLIRLSSAVKEGEVSPQVAASAIDVLESFLFRRAICGIEPTGLHAVFKGLWVELTQGDGAPGVSAESVRLAISKRPTVPWPNDAEFSLAVRTGDLYSRRVVQYALREYETATEGESPSDEFQVEHICPQTATPHWQGVFGERYDELVNTWANLAPLTGRMNLAAGQESFAVKVEEYANSIFATTRSLSNDYTTWSPTELEQRAQRIGEWALTRWPYSRA